MKLKTMITMSVCATVLTNTMLVPVGVLAETVTTTEEKTAVEQPVKDATSSSEEAIVSSESSSESASETVEGTESSKEITEESTEVSKPADQKPVKPQIKPIKPEIKPIKPEVTPEVPEETTSNPSPNVTSKYVIIDGVKFEFNTLFKEIDYIINHQASNYSEASINALREAISLTREAVRNYDETKLETKDALLLATINLLEARDALFTEKGEAITTALEALYPAAEAILADSSYTEGSHERVRTILEESKKLVESVKIGESVLQETVDLQVEKLSEAINVAIKKTVTTETKVVKIELNDSSKTSDQFLLGSGVVPGFESLVVNVHQGLTSLEDTFEVSVLYNHNPVVFSTVQSYGAKEGFIEFTADDINDGIAGDSQNHETPVNFNVRVEITDNTSDEIITTSVPRDPDKIINAVSGSVAGDTLITAQYTGTGDEILVSYYATGGSVPDSMEVVKPNDVRTYFTTSGGKNGRTTLQFVFEDTTPAVPEPAPAPVKALDTSALEKALTVANTKKEADYTKASWGAFAESKVAANLVLTAALEKNKANSHARSITKDTVTQADINSATSDLVTKTNALETVKVVNQGHDKGLNSKNTNSNNNSTKGTSTKNNQSLAKTNVSLGMMPTVGGIGAGIGAVVSFLKSRKFKK